MDLVKCFRCAVLLSQGNALVLEVGWRFPDGEEVVHRLFFCPACGPVTRYRLDSVLGRR